jgi:heme/copper-type cytochrome/quinol oxidase subunit 2
VSRTRRSGPGEVEKDVSVRNRRPSASRTTAAFPRVTCSPDAKRPRASRALIGVLTVPAGVDVEFQATSVDVVHGFWVPALKFQRQLIPGQTATFRLTFPRPGFTSNGACSFFCGLEHARMRFVIDVRSREDYEAWLRESRS